MRSTLESLTKKERELLANFYRTETYNALKKLAEFERDGLARDSLDAWQSDPKIIAYMAGGADKLKGLFVTLGQNHKQINKDS